MIYSVPLEKVGVTQILPVFDGNLFLLITLKDNIEKYLQCIWRIFPSPLITDVGWYVNVIKDLVVHIIFNSWDSRNHYRICWTIWPFKISACCRETLGPRYFDMLRLWDPIYRIYRKVLLLREPKKYFKSTKLFWKYFSNIRVGRRDEATNEKLIYCLSFRKKWLCPRYIIVINSISNSTTNY